MHDTDRSLGDDDLALADPVFSDLFEAMGAASRGPAPAPGPELSTLLSGGTVLSLSGRRHRVRVAVAGLAVVGAIAGGTGVAAATGALPQPAERFVTRVIDHLTGVDQQGQHSVDEDVKGGTGRSVPSHPSTGQGTGDNQGTGNTTDEQAPSGTATGSAGSDGQSGQTSGDGNRGQGPAGTQTGGAGTDGPSQQGADTGNGADTGKGMGGSGSGFSQDTHGGSGASVGQGNG